jgi:hypothetical protein
VPKRDEFTAAEVARITAWAVVAAVAIIIVVMLVRHR